MAQINEKIPCRLLIAFMIFTCTFVSYTLRVNVGVNIVAMVPVSPNVTQSNQYILDWTPYQRARVLSSFFWGYIIANILSGYAADRWGPRRVLFVGSLAGGVVTLLTPSAAKRGYEFMVIARVLLGFLSGFTFPNLNVLIGKWAVTHEKGKFIGAMVSGILGTVFAWSVCGVVIEPFGWEWGFYVFGIISVTWSVLWWYTVYDSPNEHPRITSDEKEYIMHGIAPTNGKKKSPPYRQILTSVPVWSNLLLTFGTGWGLYFNFTAAPTFIANVLGYKLSSTGFLSASIYLTRATGNLLFGAIGDFLLQKDIISVVMLRRLACVTSNIIPGCILLALTLPDRSPSFCIVVVVIASGFNGAASQSNIANLHDLTNNFTGTLAGLGVAVNSSAGIITPLVTTYFTHSDETNIETWKSLFYIGSLVYILTGLQWLVFGSTKLQKWNGKSYI